MIQRWFCLDRFHSSKIYITCYQCLLPLKWQFRPEFLSLQSVLDITFRHNLPVIYDTDQYFPMISCINKYDCHNINEMLLKFAFRTYKQTQTKIKSKASVLHRIFHFMNMKLIKKKHQKYWSNNKNDILEVLNKKNFSTSNNAKKKLCFRIENQSLLFSIIYFKQLCVLHQE